MRLPLPKETHARRQLLRQLIWSLCIVAPSSLAIADEGTTKKTELSSAPALTLPTFPSALPTANTSSVTSSPASQSSSSSGPALLPTLPPAVGTATAPKAKLPAATPTVSLPSAPHSTPSSSSTVPAALSPAPKAIVPPPPETGSAEKVGVVISMPKTQSPASAPTAINTAKTSAVPTANDHVSIKFGAAVDKPKQLENNPPQVKRPVAVPVADANSSFRLSDKANTTTTPPSAADSAPKLLTPKAPKSLPATSSSTAPALKFSDNLQGVEPKLGEAKVVESKPATMPQDIGGATAKVDPKQSLESKPTTIGSLTVSKEGLAPSTPIKDDMKREAVLIRPKAIVLGQEPTAMAKSDKSTAESIHTKKGSQPASPKPSTSPQALATTQSGTSSTKMKSVDSKVSPLPPSQHSSAEKVAVKLSDSVKAAEPIQLLPESAAPAPKSMVAQTPPAAQPPVPSIPAAPAVSAPLPLSSFASQSPAAPVKMPDAVVVAPLNDKVVATDVAHPVVSGAEISTETELASAKKYSKPADHTIQVGTVALTTMRVDDKDVIKCEVEDATVCRAIVTADGEVALLPGKVGVTRATLWVKEANGQSKVETADIQVGEVLPIAHAESVAVGKLNDNLQRLYPNTTLRVVASDRCIEICGEADSEQQAREVLQLVRKLCLVPVKDKVTVR